MSRTVPGGARRQTTARRFWDREPISFESKRMVYIRWILPAPHPSPFATPFSPKGKKKPRPLLSDGLWGEGACITAERPLPLPQGRSGAGASRMEGFAAAKLGPIRRQSVAWPLLLRPPHAPKAIFQLRLLSSASAFNAASVLTPRFRRRPHAFVEAAEVVGRASPLFTPFSSGGI